MLRVASVNIQTEKHLVGCNVQGCNDTFPMHECVEWPNVGCLGPAVALRWALHLPFRCWSTQGHAELLWDLEPLEDPQRCLPLFGFCRATGRWQGQNLGWWHQLANCESTRMWEMYNRMEKGFPKNKMEQWKNNEAVIQTREQRKTFSFSSLRWEGGDLFLPGALVCDLWRSSGYSCPSQSCLWNGGNFSHD